MSQTRPFQQREPRLPMVVEVETHPAVPDCWSVNVSRSGIGLVCAGGIELAVREGDEIALSFGLPGSGETIRGRGTVMWLYGRPARSGKGVETAIGVGLNEIAAGDSVAFGRYLLEHRFHVAVAFPTADEVEAIARTFGDHYHLHYEATGSGVLAVLGRGDVSAVVVCGGEGRTAIDLVEAIHARFLEPRGAHLLPPDLMPRIIYCATGSSEQLVGLFNARRVFRSLPPPLEPETLRQAVQEACSAHGERTEQRRVAHSLERSLARLRASTRPEADLTDSVVRRVVFASAAMEGVVERARRVAPHKVSVLLQGETGTGKEVLATLLHELSMRAASPLVIQDCGVLTDTLLESELFGHVKGAFTGAVANNPGLFLMADGGTVFLDEIENTTPDLQAKLLRVIETGTVRAVGSTQARHADVRVIAASNRDLALEVAAGRFRADLFYRLNSFPIRLPPLRERRDDIGPLVDHFLAVSNEKLGLHAPGFTEAARTLLRTYDWPGNVRELRNSVEAAVLLSEPQRLIGVDLLPDAVRVVGAASSAPLGESLKERVRHHERQLIETALSESDGVLRRAARRLETHPATLRRKAVELGLVPGRRGPSRP